MFSVVIPLYNKSKHVLSTIDSVLKQTFSDFQIVIVNDGSTDDSLEVVQSVKDNRIVIYSTENGGASKARNYGIEKSTKPYVAFLDADDYWEVNYLEEMSKLIIENPNCGMFASAYRVVYKHKTVEMCTNLPRGLVQNYFKEMITQTLTWTSATIVRRDIFDDVGGFPIGMVAGQDTFTWAKIAAKHSVAFTPKVLASYLYIHSGIGLRQGRMDSSEERWADLLVENDFYRNEYVAKKGLLVGIRYAIGNFKTESKSIEKLYSFNKLSRRRFRILYVLNRLPFVGIKLYKRIFDIYMKLKVAV